MARRPGAWPAAGKAFGSCHPGTLARVATAPCRWMAESLHFRPGNRTRTSRLQCWTHPRLDRPARVGEGAHWMREPFVTVILAVRNEAAYIARCLSAVLAQDWPNDRLEIIVADGESTDGTPDIIGSLPGSERVRLIVNRGRRQSAGLNLAIAQAEG